MHLVCAWESSVTCDHKDMKSVSGENTENIQLPLIYVTVVQSL